MLISFFTKTEFVAWVDYSWHPDCIHQEEVDIDLSIQVPVLIGNEGEYSIEVEEKESPPETPEEKHARIRSEIISGDLEDIDLEWEFFSDFEIGEIITDRVFGGNPHAEKALTNKVLAVTLAILQGVEMTEAMSEKIVEATAKKAEVDAVRNLFNLGNL